MSKPVRIVTTPPEVGAVAIGYLDRLQRNGGKEVPILLPGLDGFFAPALPGELVVVLGWTSHGKSTFSREWVARLSRYMIERGMVAEDGSGGSVIAWADTETPIEHLALSALAREAGLNLPEIVYRRTGQKVQGLPDAARRIAGTPIYPLTTRDSSDANLLFADVTLTNIQQSLLQLKRGEIDGNKHEIYTTVIDWLQSLPMGKEAKRAGGDKGRSQQVEHDVNVSRDMGSSQRLDCVVILNAQAKQADAPKRPQMRPDAKGNPPELILPDVYSGEWSSNIGKRADRVISVTNPARAGYPVGRPIVIGDWSGPVTPGLVAVEVLKQRLEGLPAPGLFIYHYNPRETDPFQRYELIHKEDQGYRAPWGGTWR